ncbi:MAG TPA: type I-E CRISPR-associated protein Cas5/CasD [Terriglobia bacterium]|nr:type I-E CRISPR-associated protein Cas5/CasD [Terriglobia bacterium]
MSDGHNTLFIRLAGLMQSWGTSSRFQLRRTDLYPSKSGVLGLLLCANGVRREDSEGPLAELTLLSMGVRVDRAGILDWDFHTAGAKFGIRQAKGGIKYTASTGELELSLSRRQYLYDASFFVALQGDNDTIGRYAGHLQDPIWPVFLGRKCCVPAEPVFAGTGSFETLEDALSSIPWHPRINAIDRDDWRPTRTLEAYIERPFESAPNGARLVYDVPRRFGYWSHSPRRVEKHQVTVRVGQETQPRPFSSLRASAPDREALAHRMATDHYLCVFCKAPAEEVHHVSYENYGHETDDDLRSLCRTCHRACSMLEYGHDMSRHRVDPMDATQRSRILNQIERLLNEGRPDRWRELLTAVRAESNGFFDAASEGVSHEER